MASVNKVFLIGNLGADPEVKSFQSGGQIATLRIATSESWKDRSTGERKERTEWHTVVISGDGLIGIVQRYLRKGSKVCIEGQLRTRKWSDRDGNDRYSTEIVVAGRGGALTMLDSANGGQGGDGRGERKRGYDDRGGRQAGHGNDDWGDGREVYNSNRGGWQDSGNSGGGSGDSWGGGGFGDDLDDDIPF